MLKKVVLKRKYHILPFPQLKMQLSRIQCNIAHLYYIVRFGPTLFVDYCIYKNSGTLPVNILQTSLEFESNNLDFCFEDIFKILAVIESTDLISIFQLSIDSSCFYTGSSLQSTHSIEALIKSRESFHRPTFRNMA